MTTLSEIEAAIKQLPEGDARQLSVWLQDYLDERWERPIEADDKLDESEAATQELLAISGLLDRVKQNQATPQSQYASWRTLRSDV